MTDLVCGIDLGGTKLLGLAIDPAAHEPVLAHKEPTPSGADSLGLKVGDEKNGHGLCPPAMFALWNLETWREWESAVDTLYRHGCRA